MEEDKIEFVAKKEFNLFTEMMIKCLITDDVVTGFAEALYLLKTYLQSGEIVLHRKFKNGIYIFDSKDISMNKSLKQINSTVNKMAPLIERKKLFYADFSLDNQYKNMMFIELNTQNSDYILSINNFNSSIKLEEDFLARLRDTMQIILKRAESYEHNIKAITTDLLTDLDNRNSYEMKIQSISENNENMVFGIFDLFRLKYINDNFGHSVGDIYIKETAKILKKYWPKVKYDIIEGERIEHLTGSCIYRIGGDEFALMTTVEPLDLSHLKAEYASEEVCTIDLDIDKKVPIGLNFGIVKREPNTSIKKTYDEADKLMSKDKHKMYLKYNLERRK